MRASLNWIKELLPNLKATPAAIEQKLTAVGIEVEAVERQADAYDGIVTAEVKTLAPHPEADRLQIAEVFDGERTVGVVCGASNVAVGQKVALAKVGAKLPVGIEIARRAIRGVTSEGMICSEQELGLAESSDGILVLNRRSRPGKPIASVIGQTDVVFELGVTPNRPDVLSHLGVARELAAIYGLPLPAPTAKPQTSGEPASTRAKVEIRGAQRCPRYVARVVEGVKVGPSPAWVARRLEAVGLRPISNVVDATNLALLELGHPLHAFDLDKLAGNKIVVRVAKATETLTTIDGEVRKLDPDDLVIADATDPVALAGVMGGGASEVTDGTVNLLLESAMFDPRSVRRSSKRHGLHTEASHRFERGADPLALELAIDRCAELILQLAGGRLLPGRVEVVKREPKQGVVYIRPERAALLLGRPVDRKEVRGALTALGLKKVKPPGDDERLPRAAKKRKKKTLPASAMFFSIPSWRVDLEREEDLIEEVARLVGYDTIPAVMPNLGTEVWTAGRTPDPVADVRAALVAEGFFESISLAFSAGTHLEAMGFDVERAVRLTNPLGAETALMRMSLLPSMLRSARLNQGHQRTDLRLFELGRTFRWAQPPGALPVEASQVALVLRGRRLPPSWSSGKATIDAFDLKAVLEGLLDALRICGASYAAPEPEVSWLHPRSATCVRVGDVELGVMGELHPDVATRFELEGDPLFVAELSVAALHGARGGISRFCALPRFPGVGRDLSFFIDRAVPSASILATVRTCGAANLSSVDVFDVYEGKGLPEGQRSIAVTMQFRAADRTLTDDEVDAAQQAVMTALEQSLGASIRRGS